MITKKCTASGKEFIITESDLDFYKNMEVISKEDYEKLKSREISDCVGLPTLCPEERQRRRISYKNFRSLHQRKCNGTGKTIISMYNSDQKFPVYENEYWWGDSWNPLDYGQEFDFSRSFFEQYNELASKVPRYSTLNMQCENCTYANMAWGSKNCYLVFGCVRDEDCLYGHIVWDSTDCVDNVYIFRCQWCSECVDGVDCYNLHFSTECTNCYDSYFLHDCRGCKNCFGCTNLRQKEYCFMNKQLSKAEYEQKIREISPINSQTIEMGKEWLEKTKKETCIFPDLFGLKNEKVSGNHIYEAKNCHHSFDAKRGEDSKFLYTSYEQFNSYDISFTGYQTRFCYESIALHASENSLFCHNVNNSLNALYSEFCVHCTDIIGCNGLRNKQYCILNKQYSKEEYFTLREKIIEHMKATPLRDPKGQEMSESEWGEFFPMHISPFAYNEAIVQEYFPLSESEIASANLQYRTEKQEFKYDGPKYEIPKNINDVSDEILEKILTCDATGKYYKIQKAELVFYRKMDLPIPRLCPDERHKRRMALRNPRKLFSRNCDKCNCEIQTTFSPDRPEKVYCEKCYLNEVN